MKKTWVNVLIALLAAALVAAAVAVAFDIKGNRRAEAKEYEHNITYFFAAEEGCTRFIADSVLLEDKLLGRVDSFLSCDGTVGIARAGTGLYRVDKDGVKMIYSTGVNRGLLSLDGQKIVFTTATELHIYDHLTGGIEDVKPEGISAIPSIVISPDGGTVGYTVKDAEGKYVSYAYENGRSRKLDDNAYIVAISNGAGFRYFIEPETFGLYYAKGGSKKLIAASVSQLIEFNRDLTEVMFDVNGVTYYSIKGRAKKTVVDGASVFTTVAGCASVQGGENCQSSVKDTSSLFGGLFYSNLGSSTDENARSVYNIWYVDSNRRATALVRGAYQFAVTKDGGRLSVLTADSELYTMRANDPKTAKLVSENVYSYTVSRDGERFYCIGYDLGLYLIEGDSQAVQLAKNTVYSVLAGEDKCLFIADYEDSAGKLIYADGRRPLTGISDGVAHAENLPGGYFYYVGPRTDSLGNSVYDVYVSADGVNFTLAVEGALMGSGEE